MIMENETGSRKMSIVCSACCFGVVALIMMSLYWARAQSVTNMQEHKYAPTYSVSETIIAYDVSCGAPFTDDDAAMQIMIDGKGKCDEDCQKAGSRWSHVFIINGVILSLMLVNFCCVCCGSRIAFARFCGAICACCICCAHIPIILASAVYRFRPQGMFCALSERPTYYEDTEKKPTDQWTYAKDGALILGLLLIQLLCFCCCCLTGITYPVDRKKIRKNLKKLKKKKDKIEIGSGSSS